MTPRYSWWFLYGHRVCAAIAIVDFALCGSNVRPDWHIWLALGWLALGLFMLHRAFSHAQDCIIKICADRAAVHIKEAVTYARAHQDPRHSASASV